MNTVETNNDNILEALKNIQRKTQEMSQVEFVFHPWMEFNNINMDGFRIPAINSPKIPRLKALPLIETPLTHIDSRKSATTNKYVPAPIGYTKSIQATYTDLLNRYGMFGLVRLTPLGCQLHEAVRLVECFDRIMEPYHKYGVLEDLTRFFGIESPISETLATRQSNLKSTWAGRVKHLWVHKELSDAEYERFTACEPFLARSAELAHRTALMPSDGILPKSIREINLQRKPKYDQTDVFIMNQFPGYNADTIIQKSQDQGVKGLTEVFKQLLEEVRNPNLAAQATSAVEQVAPEILQPTNGNGSSESLEEAAVVGEPEEDVQELDLSKCQGTTAAGSQCQRPPVDGRLYCIAHEPKEVEAAEAATV